jgi:hypothetical protein
LSSGVENDGLFQQPDVEAIEETKIHAKSFPTLEPAVSEPSAALEIMPPPDRRFFEFEILDDPSEPVLYQHKNHLLDNFILVLSLWV